MSSFFSVDREGVGELATVFGQQLDDLDPLARTARYILRQQRRRDTTTVKVLCGSEYG
jgi:hypothetical protein